MMPHLYGCGITVLARRRDAQFGDAMLERLQLLAEGADQSVDLLGNTEAAPHQQSCDGEGDRDTDDRQVLAAADRQQSGKPAGTEIEKRREQ
jgi:hypothetical protein